MVVGDRAIRGSMATAARLREPLLSGYVVRYHPRFAGPDEDRFWFREFSVDYGRPSSYARMRPTLEGGDILVLRDDLLLMGYSERTKKTTIERLAESLHERGSRIRRIFVVALPPARSYMHLDTVFTMISREECLVYAPMIFPDGAEEADVYQCDLTRRPVAWTSETDLLSALKSEGLELSPVRCGGSDPISERREQWTDGANAFTLRPGLILGYERNEQTYNALAAAGYRIIPEGDIVRWNVGPGGAPFPRHRPASSYPEPACREPSGDPQHCFRGGRSRRGRSDPRARKGKRRRVRSAARLAGAGRRL